MAEPSNPIERVRRTIASTTEEPHTYHPAARAHRNYEFGQHGFKEVIGKRGSRDVRKYLPALHTLRQRILDKEAQ